MSDILALCMFRKKEFLIILLILITEVLGFSLILPFLPFYAQEFGASEIQIGLLLGVFSFFQFFSAPIMGKLSDRYGRRPLLLASQISTAIGFAVLGGANSLALVFASRMIDGILGSNGTIAMAYLSDISSKEDRSKAFSFIGIAFGLGFMVGPALGGFLSRFGYHVPAFLAAVFSMATVLLTVLFLPETVKRKKKIKLSIPVIIKEALQLKLLTYFWGKEAIKRKLFLFAAFIFSHALWISTFALFGEKQLSLDASGIGFLLAYAGLITVLLRGFLIGRLIDRVSEPDLLKGGVISATAALFLTAFANHYSALFATIGLYAFGSGLIRPLVVGSISRDVGEDEQGAVLGVTDAISSLGQIISPIIGGFLLQHFFPGSAGMVAAVVLALGGCFLFVSSKLVQKQV